MELDRFELQHDNNAELTRIDDAEFREAHCLESATEVRVATGRLCGDARFFVVRCARPGRLRATQQMPFAAFQELRRQLGEQAALVKSPFPAAPPSPARRFAAKFFRASVDAAAADRARARALEAWLGEVVQLCVWGTLAPRACWAVRDALLYDECVVVEPSPAKAASGRLSPVPAAPVTPPAVPSPPKSPPRELLEDQPPRPPGDDTTNELDFDDCGRDPGPCAIARALSQLQSSVAPRRMVMV